MNTSESLLVDAYLKETAETDAVLATIVNDLMVGVAREVHDQPGLYAPAGFNNRDTVREMVNASSWDTTQPRSRNSARLQSSYSNMYLADPGTAEIGTYNIRMVAELPNYGYQAQKNMESVSGGISRYSPDSRIFRRFRRKAQQNLHEAIMQDADRFHVSVGGLSVLDIKNARREGEPATPYLPDQLSDEILHADLGSAIGQVALIGQSHREKSEKVISLLEQIPRW